MKRPYLVAYDYGMGGLWAYIWAESPDQITATLDVAIVDELPAWLAESDHGLQSAHVDAPPDWAKAEKPPKT